MSGVDGPLENRKKFVAENKLADIVFLLGEKEEQVPAFKQMLASSAPVFEKMLCSGKFKDETEIKIPEFDAEDFKHFLNYMYFEKIDFEVSDSIRIYEIAHKYAVDSLLDLCRDQICKEVSYSNVFGLIEWLNIYEDEKIDLKAKDFFAGNAIGCLTVNPGFKGLSKESVAKILKLNEIRCSEVLLYENLLAWADQQLQDQEKTDICQKKMKILDELLPLIKLKINHDLTFDPLYTASRYNWNFNKTDYNNLVESSETTWNLNYETTEKTVCFGFKMILSNLGKTMEKEEEFTFSTMKNNEYKALEEFKIPIRDSMIIKDVYFKNPIILEDQETFAFYLNFKNVDNRLMMQTATKTTIYCSNCGRHSNQSQTTTDPKKTVLTFFTQKYCDDLHKVFAKYII